jgi:hypothetical protein
MEPVFDLQLVVPYAALPSGSRRCGSCPPFFAVFIYFLNLFSRIKYFSFLVVIVVVYHPLAGIKRVEAIREATAL